MLVSVQLQTTQLTTWADLFAPFKWIAHQFGCTVSFWHVSTAAEKLQVSVPGEVLLSQKEWSWSPAPALGMVTNVGSVHSTYWFHNSCRNNEECSDFWPWDPNCQIPLGRISRWENEGKKPFQKDQKWPFPNYIQIIVVQIAASALKGGIIFLKHLTMAHMFRWALLESCLFIHPPITAGYPPITAPAALMLDNREKEMGSEFCNLLIPFTLLPSLKQGCGEVGISICSRVAAVGREVMTLSCCRVDSDRILGPISAQK